ncbi:MAG: fumarylacetoacetate hydrolase family protein [Eubacteriaceae bacterium]|nr:fumarylacetoacetate hydrolase family protein [Eubacteriaceae bacterium]
MKYVNFRMLDQENLELGLLVEDRILKLKDLLENFPLDLPENMIGFIEKYEEYKPLIEKSLANKKLPVIPVNLVKIESPIPYPRRNVICLGKNYLDHAEEIKSIPGAPSQVPTQPIYFTKIAYPAIGQGDTILNHKEITESVDYEVELAIVIGKKGKNISKEMAADHIFGYTIGNDVSVRNLQMRHTQWFKGKSLDTCCPLGPSIVTKDEFTFPPDLEIESRVNGELRQRSKTSKLIFDIPYIISDLSQGLTLYPGDIIMTGTPAGVGFAFDPPKTLIPGDKVECFIQGIGTLVNYLEK